MVQTIFIGIAAGLASALLFLSPISGAAIAFPLFALTGLPLAIVGLGWGTLAASLAAAAAAVVIFTTVNIAALAFLALFGVPVVWLTRLVLMSRAEEGAGTGRQWYPLDRILLHTAVASALGVVFVGFLNGYQAEAMVQEATARLTEALAQLQSAETALTAADIESMVRVYVAFLPFLLALFMTAVTVLDLWLGSLVARASTRLPRPRDRFSMVVLPNQILAGFAVAFVLAFVLPEGPGQIAAVFAGAFAAGLVLVGLAVLHVVTSGMGGRIPLLILIYILLVFSGLPIALFALLGAAETFLHLRARRFPYQTKP